MIPTVGERMTENPRTVSPEDTLLAVLDVMMELNVRHVPVVDEEGNLVGLVSQRDLVQATAAVSDFPLHMRRDLFTARNVGEAMVTGIETVTPDTSLRDVAEMMLENKFGCMPVCEGLVLVGIITEADFVRYVFEELPAE